MRQLILVPTLVCAALLLTGALDRQALFSDTPAAAFRARGPETDAGTLLDEVLAAFAPQQVHSLDMTVWQKMDGGEPYEAEGHYRISPNQHVRLDMKVLADGKIGHLLAVSDDLTLRKAHWVDGGQPAPAIIALPCKEVYPDPLALAEARQKLLDVHGCGGICQMLTVARGGLLKPRRQSGTWQDHAVIKISGAWNADENTLTTLPANFRPRHCNLILDARTLWPFRIEWIGDPSVILLQMEFRNPVITKNDA
jgi:hypothetical protein